MYCSICKTFDVTIMHGYGCSLGNGVVVCNSCYGEFNTMMNLMNKNNYSATTSYLANWGRDSANRWIMESEGEQLKEKAIKQSEVKEEMKQREERWINYLGGLATAFTEEIHSDIQVKPGDGPSVPAHKFLLATRSEVFKHMLSSDACKSAQIDSVCLPEFNHEELQTFLEFLYCGNLAKEKFEMHYYCLALASHKYAIPHLEKFCEEHILKLIDSSNALKVLEISEICSNETLRVAALQMIIDHKEEIICAPSFEEFAIQNPRLVATRSEVFKHMLSSDTCKSDQIDSVCLPEFNNEELQTFLEFLYCGNLAMEKFEMHYYCLALASHKYAIPHLEKFCEEHILKLIDY
ncbi:hypothetical protein MKX03_023195 [Papaver bracteatum]|nr:hypothetical protein MKX03_023195 [Papaver bracteatum]